MPNVVLAPDAHPQFLDAAGEALANGFIYTYDAGTTNLRSTYADSAGTIANPNPIPLDASGAPTNGSVQVGIWLANQTYKFIAYDADMVQQWAVDNISGYFGLLNLPNLWNFQQTYAQPIVDTAVDNQIVLGNPALTTTLDFPPPTTPVVLHFPKTNDTIVGRNTTDTLTNKTLVDPKITGIASGLVTTVYKNSAPVTQTGDTSLHTIFTVPIPANALGLTGLLRITLIFTATTVGAGGVTVLINYGGTRISAAATIPTALSNTNGLYVAVLGGNSGATDAQTWETLTDNAMASASGAGNIYHQTSAVDSTATQDLTVTFQGGANTDSVTFQRLLVELL